MSDAPVRNRQRFRLAAAAMVGFTCALLGVGLVPAKVGAAGPTRVALRLMPGAGETRLRLTPLGTITADTHRAPARVELSLVEADVEDLARSAVSTTGRIALQQEVREDLSRLVRGTALQSWIGVTIISVAVSALLFGRKGPVLVASTVGSATGAVLIGALVMTTYDLDAFEQPRFSGALAHAHQVIDAVAQSEEVLDQAKSRFDVATDRLSDLLVLLAEPNPDPREAGTVVLHVSDIHANPIGFQITRRLAREFDVDAILDTGDIGSAELDTGEISTAIDPIDSAIARELGKAEVPYLFVAGNHDSPQLRARIVEHPGVEELDDSTVQLGTLTILGWADPTFSTEPVPEEEKAQRRLEVAPVVNESVTEINPDVLAVHDSRLASDSLGDVPLVLTGHTHERGETVEDGTLILTVGSTGATGLKHLTFESGRDYEAEILYFNGDDLVALDYVSFEDIGGDFELSRRTFEPDDSAP